jgi:hypothetical protein
MGALDGDVAAFLEQEPGADGVGRKLSQLLLGFLTTEVVPLANRLAELGIDPTPLFATTNGILRLYADTLERPDPREETPSLRYTEVAWLLTVCRDTYAVRRSRGR